MTSKKCRVAGWTWRRLALVALMSVGLAGGFAAWGAWTLLREPDYSAERMRIAMESAGIDRPGDSQWWRMERVAERIEAVRAEFKSRHDALFGLLRPEEAFTRRYNESPEDLERFPVRWDLTHAALLLTEEMGLWREFASLDGVAGFANLGPGFENGFGGTPGVGSSTIVLRLAALRMRLAMCAGDEPGALRAMMDAMNLVRVTSEQPGSFSAAMASSQLGVLCLSVMEGVAEREHSTWFLGQAASVLDVGEWRLASAVDWDRCAYLEGVDILLPEGRLRRALERPRARARINAEFDAAMAWLSARPNERGEWVGRPFGELPGSLLSALDPSVPDGRQPVGTEPVALARMVESAWSLARGVRLMLLLEAHTLGHGAPPESLEALISDRLAAIPEDPLAPDLRFRYSARGGEGRGGYLLYGVGVDGEDNGGFLPDRASPTWAVGRRSEARGLDMVIAPGR